MALLLCLATTQVFVRLFSCFIIGYNLRMKGEILEQDEEGLTTSLNGAEPQEGYVYSENERAEVTVPENGDLKEMIALFIGKHYKELNDAGTHVGVWHENGKYYIDVVKVASSKTEALERAKKHGQLAVYDLKGHNIIYVK